MILANSWTPEQWILVLTAVFGSFGAMVTGVVAAVRSTGASHNAAEVARQVTPPSDGVTLGQLAEGMAQVQHFMAGLQAEQAKKDPPLSPVEIARDIQNGVNNG